MAYATSAGIANEQTFLYIPFKISFLKLVL